MRIGISWSGGKDSCLAAIIAQQMGHTPVALLNMMNENGKISRSHALPHAVLQQQAQACGLPLHTVATSWADYEANFVQQLVTLKNEYQLEGMVFGDIDLQPHRDWEEMVCAKAGLTAILPLWKWPRNQVIAMVWEQNIHTHIVSCNTQMGENFLGEQLTPALVKILEEKGIDACGENGEYHTVVTHCSLFHQAIPIQFGKKYTHQQYCFIETGSE
jgi:diphthine-ammonia ligase